MKIVGITKWKKCSRCNVKHDGPHETCNRCRAYNNWNKFIYEFAEKHELTYEESRQGLKDVLAVGEGFIVKEDET